MRTEKPICAFSECLKRPDRGVTNVDIDRVSPSHYPDGVGPTIFESENADEIVRVWRTVSPDSQLDEISSTHPHFRWASKQLDGLTLIGYSMHGRVRARTDDGTRTVAGELTAGDAQLRSGEYTARLGDAWLMSGQGRYVAWDTYAQIRLVAIDLDDLELASLITTGLGPARRGPLALSAQSREFGRFWTSTLGFATRTLLGDHPLDNPLIDASFRAQIIQAMCVSFGLERDSVRNHRPSTTAAVRRALAYIDDHAAEPITVADIAQAARMSVRGLQDAFRRSLDTTPTQQLRRARLDAAHRALTQADSDSAGVADIAHHWGFPHVGRFARYYRDEFGQAPSATLRG